ncbi:MAG: aspartate dehydrogenase [Aquabacterium sp.]
MAALRVAVIGAGAIGGVVVRELAAAGGRGVVLAGVLVRDPARASGLPGPQVRGLPALLALRPQLVVEAAGQAAVHQYGPTVLRAGCDLLVSSVGALADAALADALDAAARAAGRQVLLPAGALGGLDWLAAAQMAGLHRVHYRSRKPPAAWRGTPAESALDLDALHTATVFFEGSARDAAHLYPKNANVAAALALATLGLDAVQVELVADPAATGNRHEIEAEGVAGRLRLELDNAASADNPRTSLITPYSLLRRIHARWAPLAT